MHMTPFFPFCVHMRARNIATCGRIIYIPIRLQDIMLTYNVMGTMGDVEECGGWGSLQAMGV